MSLGKSSKTTINICIGLIAGALCLGFSDDRSAWQKIWAHIGTSQAREVIADVRPESGFWFITSNALYHLDSERKSSLILHKRISQIFQGNQDPDTIYIAAEDGIYKRSSRDLRRILFKHGCLSIVSSNGKLLAGTSSGLLVGDETKNIWSSAAGILANQPISRLASYGNVVYIVTPTSLYRYDTASEQYKRIFSGGVSSEIDSENDDGEGSVEKTPEILDVDIAHDGKLYVSTRKGIYYSKNSGDDWMELSSVGLPLNMLNALSIAPNELNIWAATEDGAYRLNGERWEKYAHGLETNGVYDLDHAPDGMLYAATNRGFFYLSKGGSFTEEKRSALEDSKFTLFQNYADIERNFRHEPTIREVQEMAVDYADVHPDKIKRWHRQSRLKAFVPSLSTGLDRSATDLMHWDTGGNPDTLLKGRDYVEWDVSLSWNLGDMVWSSDQTSIDSRSKLMVELREEVLDQVTRIYFERRRLQISLLQGQDQGDVTLDDHMRLAELTAIIDGFTGGEFIRRIERIGQRS